LGKFVLTIEDQEDGSVAVDHDFDPPLDLENSEPTLAAFSGYAVMKFLVDNFVWHEGEDEPEPEENQENPPEVAEL